VSRVFNSRDFEQVPCPICRGTDFKALVSNDRYAMGIRTVGCTGCGFVLTNPQPKSAALKRFYEEHYRETYQKVDVPDLQYIQAYKKDVRCKETVDFLAHHGALRGESRVLDVGASEGALLKQISLRFPLAECTAIEPNAPFREFARQYAECSAYADLGEVQGERFDLVTLNHVLEHVQDLGSVLLDIASRMSPQSHLYIDVPSVCEYRTVEDFHVGHLYHFGPTSLRRLLTAHGFQVLVLESHHPVMHPPSLRALCVYTGGSDPAPSENLSTEKEGWDACRRAARTVWAYNFRRGPLGQFLAKGKRIIRRRLG
jgi:predicted TPR repeat methyltransferase